jgi:hypothetical protein
LDRLVSLLESGSSSSIRQTAAKQLAQLATKNVSGDIPFVADDSKHHAADYSSLMAVVSRVIIVLLYLSHSSSGMNPPRFYLVYVPRILKHERQLHPLSLKSAKLFRFGRPRRMTRMTKSRKKRKINKFHILRWIL